MTSNLTPDEQETMRVAAHGVLNLMASADPDRSPRRAPASPAARRSPR